MGYISQGGVSEGASKHFLVTSSHKPKRASLQDIMFPKSASSLRKPNCDTILTLPFITAVNLYNVCLQWARHGLLGVNSINHVGLRKINATRSSYQ